MFRSEAMVDLAGAAPELAPGISLGKGGTIVNNTLMDLHDAVLLDVDASKTTTPGASSAQRGKRSTIRCAQLIDQGQAGHRRLG